MRHETSSDSCPEGRLRPAPQGGQGQAGHQAYVQAGCDIEPGDSDKDLIDDRRCSADESGCQACGDRHPRRPKRSWKQFADHRDQQHTRQHRPMISWPISRPSCDALAMTAMGPARTASPNADQMATGRRPTASDSRPSTHAAPAVTANVAAVIDNVATRSSFLVAARWFGMKTKKRIESKGARGNQGEASQHG